jgi:hypothetical protein
MKKSVVLVSLALFAGDDECSVGSRHIHELLTGLTPPLGRSSILAIALGINPGI